MGKVFVGSLLYQTKSLIVLNLLFFFLEDTNVYQDGLLKKEEILKKQKVKLEAGMTVLDQNTVNCNCDFQDENIKEMKLYLCFDFYEIPVFLGNKLSCRQFSRSLIRSLENDREITSFPSFLFRSL